MVGLCLLMGCSTKKNTFTARAFHNLTSHYNVYWNGEKSLMEGDEQLRAAVKDDYSKVLRVYNYGTKQEGMALNAKMDRALEKTSICVQKHSMKFNNRERVRWIDDAYLVMAKAHFYKQDYIPARRTFDFVASEYGYNDLALVANMWLVKTYVQTEQYPKAAALIEQLQAKAAGMNKPPKELSQNLDFTIADYYIAVKDYKSAVKYLKNGLLMTKDRELRTRAMFILGQIYMLQNDGPHAIEQFSKVIKRNPVYEMAFESRMNMAKMGSADDAESLYKMLNKMLRDPNNDEYIDRIFYAMAELALREGDQDKAIRYLRKSVAAFKTNTIQRGASSLKVATMLFARNDYELSQAYYDTAMMSLDRDFEGYDSINNISQTLNELVMNLSVIRDQDSLLRVAAMDSVSRNALIDRIIAQVIEEEKMEEERRQYEEQIALMGGATGEAALKDEMEQKAGAWYYYNSTTLTRGYTEFAKKWGMRKLEDNWFISDKRSMQSAFADELAEDGAEMEGKGKNPNDTLSGKSYTNHDRGYYLSSLPFTQEQKAECDSMIRNSLYNVAFLYMDRLTDYPRSIDSYETLDSRYPGNDKELPSWYALYFMYKRSHDDEKATYYKGKIFDKYPNSNYAQVIKDPDFYQKLKAQENESADFYAKTYEAYQQGQYYRVKMNTERAMAMYEADTALMPRFMFLNAVARGRLESVDTMAFALYDLVRKYPNSSISAYATSVLANVNETYNIGIDMSKISDKEAEAPTIVKATPYVYDVRGEHFVMIVCSKQVRVEPLKVRLSDFNKKEHGLRTFNVKSVILDDQNTIVTVGNFDGEQQARDYIASMFLTDYVFGGIAAETYTILPISSKNYPVFYQAKNVEEYKTFLDNNK